MANRDLIAHLAFAVRDERMSRLAAQRMVRTILGLLREGDEIGSGLIVRSFASEQTTKAELVRRSSTAALLTVADEPIPPRLYMQQPFSV